MRRAEQDVDRAGPVDLVLLGNDDGEGGAGSAHVLQRLSERHLRVEEDQIHHHAQITNLPSDRLGILPTVVCEAEVHKRQTHTHRHTPAI